MCCCRLSLLVLLRAEILGTNKPQQPRLYHIHSKLIFQAFSKLHMLFYIRNGRKAAQSAVHSTQMRYWKSERDELGGSGMGHYVITERWSQKGIKMFQTNITPHALSCSNALHQYMCVFARALEQIRKRDTEAEGVRPQFWVCLLCEWVISESVAPVCHCLRGLWVCQCSSSPPSPGSSSTPALSSRHRAAGQGFLSNWSQCEQIRVASVFLPFLFLCHFFFRQARSSWN